jgi:hypothetical protein
MALADGRRLFSTIILLAIFFALQPYFIRGLTSVGIRQARKEAPV